MRVLHNCEIFRNFAGDLMNEGNRGYGLLKCNIYETEYFINAVAAVGGDGVCGKQRGTG